MPPIWTVLLLAVIFTTESLPIAPDGSAGGHKISLNRPADDQMIGDVNRSVKGDHIYSPNPSQPGSFCLNCAVHNCSNQTTKDHLCLCQRGRMWQNCDDSELEMSSSTEKPSEKVPANICHFVNPCNYGKCVPKSVYPGYECKCGDPYTGTNCSQWSALGWLFFFLVIFGTPVVFVVICRCVNFCVQLWKGPEIIWKDGEECPTVEMGSSTTKSTAKVPQQICATANDTCSRQDET